jgi:S-ribosylhomocysteine lyase LuxS involved in autoinducer biosynthesis
MGVPFATAAQCGQFTYHHPEKAQESLKKVNIDTVNVEHTAQETIHQKAVVCDLRLLKPKTHEQDERITLDPKLSYYLSHIIEKELPKKMPGTAVVVGTFGCMTGTYLCVSCVNPETDITIVHKHIIDILREMNMDSFTETHQEQLKTILENYKQH